ncbi:MAG: DNA-J related domain-containing protein [Kangiellaceae bacterium]
MKAKQQILLDELKLSPDGVREYDLMIRLESKHDFFSKSTSELVTDTSLFKKHFYLFHQLYLLLGELAQSNYELQISALCIKLTKHEKTTTQPSQFDSSEIQEYGTLSEKAEAKLKEFYLDKSNLELPESEIQSMLNEFWTKYFALDKKAESINCLGLQDNNNLSRSQIKKRYSQLANQHHPDKGGDEGKFKQIKEAYEQLMLCY